MKLRCAVIFLLLASAGCGSRASAPLPDTHSQTALRSGFSTGSGKITHVVFVVQENRSFDNLFQGYPGADTVSQGMNSQDQTITLQPASLSRQYQIDHSAYAMFAACNGTGSLQGTNCLMNGFNNEESEGGPRIPNTSTYRIASRSRISTWRTSGSSPIACSSRRSMRASPPTNT